MHALAKQFDKQVQIAVPAPLAIQGDGKKVGLFQVFQCFLPRDGRVEHNCITLASHDDFNDWEFAGADGVRRMRVSGNFECNNGDAVYEAVLAGAGLARLATWLVGDDIRAGRLVPVLGQYVHEQTSIFAVYPHRRHLSPKVRAFVDFLAEKFTPIPPWELEAGQ